MNNGYFIMKSVNRILQKVQKNVIFSPFFAQKSYSEEMHVHAYHNTNSAPSNEQNNLWVAIRDARTKTGTACHTTTRKVDSMLHTPHEK